MRKKKILEWAGNVAYGLTFAPTQEELRGQGFSDASYKGPPARVRRAMIAYVKARNSFRWRRINSDYQWLRSTMEEMGMNPEDARFLL